MNCFYEGKTIFYRQKWNWLHITNFDATELLPAFMIQIKIFVFNPIQVNTYIIYDESHHAAVIDPACFDKEEENELYTFLMDNELEVVLAVNTHAHFDHILGNNFIFKKFGLKTLMHKAGLKFAEQAANQSRMFGFETEDIILPEKFLEQDEILKFGNSSLKVLYTPGHADGSVCFYSQEQGFMITGDLIFRESVGRTDLPTGNYQLLIQSIQNHILTLDEDTVLYPGHGPKTTIGHEKKYNPFIK